MPAFAWIRHPRSATKTRKLVGTLPKGLNATHIKKAVTYIEKGTADLVDIYLEQANVFSGIVGIYGVKALHAVSPYKKHKHPDVAQQRFPDLSLEENSILRRRKHWNRKAVHVRGLSSRITIIQVGTSSGGTWLIPPRASNLGVP